MLNIIKNFGFWLFLSISIVCFTYYEIQAHEIAANRSVELFEIQYMCDFDNIIFKPLNTDLI